MVYVALFAAVVAVLGLFPPIVLPVVGVPITAQSMGVMIAGSVLGARRGGLAILLFLILVAVGVPILAGGRGGFGVLLGPGGGFLFSWPIAASTMAYTTFPSAEDTARPILPSSSLGSPRVSFFHVAPASVDL